MGSNPIFSATTYVLFLSCVDKNYHEIKTVLNCFLSLGDIVQLVERMPCTHEVIGPTPIISKMVLLYMKIYLVYKLICVYNLSLKKCLRVSYWLCESLADFLKGVYLVRVIPGYVSPLAVCCTKVYSTLPNLFHWGQPDSLIAKVNKRLSYQENKFAKLRGFSMPPNSRKGKVNKPLSYRENKFLKWVSMPPYYQKTKLNNSKQTNVFEKTKYVDALKHMAICTIHSSRNNTLLTLMAVGGRVLKKGWASAGSLGFKNSRKSSSYASIAAAKSLAHVAKRCKVKTLYLKLHGVGRAKGAVVRTLQQSRLKILVIRECTPAVHNGCRSPKKRRI